MKKNACIFGVTGQDGSYLAELLLEKGYEVHGMIRRSSSFNTQRLEPIFDKLHLHYGDVTDILSIQQILIKSKPDEIYILSAQSHVQVSFTQPLYTAQVDAIGVLNIIESCKLLCPNVKIYQASTSELFGKVLETPQTEKTPFNPQSPYGIAKQYAFWITKNYRDSYGMFISNGILFNHESILKNSPLIIKDENDMVDILPIEDIFRTEKHKYEGILNDYIGKYVWNGIEWTKIINGTCYKDKNKKVKLIQTVQSCYESTYEHIVFDENDNEIKTEDLIVGQKLFNIRYPENIDKLTFDKDLAYFIGFVVGDGHIDSRGRIRLTGINKNEIVKVGDILKNKYGWEYRLYNNGPGNYDNCVNDVWVLDFNNDINFGLWIRKNIYTLRSNEKRVPYFILNSTSEIKKSFFDGYYLADGRKNGNEKYEYKGFGTKSATLCLGLLTIFSSFSKQIAKCKCDYREKGFKYYVVQFRNDNENNIGEHLKKELNEIVSIKDTDNIDGWFYDIQTESETFATGPNLVKIHNSPRRGSTFVTKKITEALVKIKNGKQKTLKLGNIDSLRDWGYSKDYVEGMWLMLQQEIPDDFVLATNETHTVREFLVEAAKYVGMDIVWNGKGIEEKGFDVNSGKVVVEIDPKYFRPSEVELLLGDATKAKEVLGWQPKVKFKELVGIMMKHDIANSGKSIVGT